MPPLPNVPQVVKTVISWTIGGDTRAATVLHFRYSGSAPSVADLQAFAAGIVSAGEGDLQGVCGAHVGMNACEATDLTSSMSAQASGGDAWVGTRSGGQLSPATAAIANYSIARRYRGGKPRSYFPVGTSTDVATTGLWTTGAQGDFESAITAFFGDCLQVVGGTTFGSHVSVSYYEGTRVVTSPTTGRARNVPILRTDPLVDAVSAVSVPVRIGSQRRRNKDT